MTLGEKIQYIRKENKLSQAEFADMIGVSRQATSKWELGESKPDLENIAMISKLFNVTTDSIIIDTVDLKACEIQTTTQEEESKFIKTAKIAGKTALKHIYILGYILIVIGAVNTVFAGILTIIWSSYSDNFTNWFRQYKVTINLDFLFWVIIFMAIIAISTLVFGIVIVVKSKRRNKRDSNG